MPAIQVTGNAEMFKPLGKYGMLRKKHLKEHRAITYNTMLLKETLYPHLD